MIKIDNAALLALAAKLQCFEYWNLISKYILAASHATLAILADMDPRL